MCGVVEAQAGKPLRLGPIRQRRCLGACHLRVKAAEPHDSRAGVVALRLEVGDATRFGAGANLQKRDGLAIRRHCRYALTMLAARIPERSQTLRVSITSLAFVTRAG